jgi:hypothetical protein
MEISMSFARNARLAMLSRAACVLVASVSTSVSMLAAWSVLGVPASTALGQERPAPDEPPAADPNADEVELLRRRTTAADDGLAPGTERKPVQGVPAAKPRAESSIPVPKVRRAREGIFVIKQRGDLLVARTGDVIFVPEKGAPAKTSRPMVLLPCQTLSRLESAAGLRSDQPTGESAPRPRVLMTGQVMVYRQREYLLPSVFQVESVSGEPAASESSGGGSATQTDSAQPTGRPSEPNDQPGDQPGDQPNDQPRGEAGTQGEGTREGEVESFIRELEDRRSQSRGLTREMARTGPAPAPASGPATSRDGAAGEPQPEATEAPRIWPIAEGSVITARRARLVRFTDGSVGVSFDNGANAVAGARRTEAPMALLACQMTQRMEEVVGGRGDKAALEVSGRVFSYGNRNYLLPSMYQVLPPTDVGPLN